MPDQRRQSLNMLASSVAQEAQAFARGLPRRADADVIEVGESEPMQREATAADVARDFAKYVEIRSEFFRNREDANAAVIGRPKQTNDARRSFDRIDHDGPNFKQCEGRRRSLAK